MRVLLCCLAVFLGQPAAGTETKTESVSGTVFVRLRGGVYEQGDWTGLGRANERPRVVEVGDFYLATTEVTVAQFRRFAAATGYRTVAEERGWVFDIATDMVRWEKKSGVDWRRPGFAQTDDHPVVWVDWEDCAAFARWLAARSDLPCRLPTEAEWEYAARSGGKRQRWSGTGDAAQLTRYAWYEANSGGAPHPVGSKLPNPAGLFDMSGNVWEWCADDLAPLPAAGTPSFRVLRGGSWRVPEAIVTTTYRSSYRTDYSHSSMGFRLAMDAPP